MDIINHLLEDLSDLLYSLPKSSEYRRMSESIAVAEKTFFEGLSESQVKQYEECVTLLLERESINTEEKTARAFILGARMMCHIMRGEE